MTQESQKNKSKIELPSLEEMLKAGVHFGHRTSKWNPKMKSFIFTARNNIHVIDLEKTRQSLESAVDFLFSLKQNKSQVLFVGTKMVIKDIIQKEAVLCKMPYVNTRWLGGTLTNFKIISKRLEYLRETEAKKSKGELLKYTKKEQHDIDVELEKMNRQFGGIKNLLKLPEALIIVDIKHEKTAVKEAVIKKIPVIGICDTNADPSLIDYPIPANEDSSSSVKLIIHTLAQALL